MRADKRHATFGVAYWRRQHPDVSPVQAQRYLIRRRWRRLLKNLKPVITAFTASFGEVQRRITAAVQQFAQVAVAARQIEIALPGPLMPAVLDDDELEWYDDNGPNPWDAHTVTFGDTLERIDGTLALHQQTAGCHCRQEPDIVMSVCDQCAFQEGDYR